jgi:hypothetical protein
MFTHPRRIHGVRLALGGAIAAGLAACTLAGPALAATDVQPADASARKAGGEQPEYLTVRKAGGEPIEYLTVRKAGGEPIEYIIAVL